MITEAERAKIEAEIRKKWMPLGRMLKNMDRPEPDKEAETMIKSNVKDEIERVEKSRLIVNDPRFTIVEQIGEGSEGRVYSAWDSKTEQEVAIKIVDPNERGKRRMEERGLTAKGLLQREGRFKAANNVVPSFYMEDEDEKPFLVMPYLHGGTLGSWIGASGNYPNGLSREMVLECLENIAEGLASFHTTYEKCHSDIKPENIFRDNGKFILGDLGSATYGSVDETSGSRVNRGFRFTRAPERFFDNKDDLEDDGSRPTLTDYSADIYSFASLATKLFTGSYLLEHEFANGDPKSVLERLGEDKVNTLIKEQLDDPRIPKKVQRLLRRCARFNPNERPQKGTVLQKELEKTLESMDFWNGLQKSLKWSIPLVLGAAAAGWLGHQIATAPKAPEKPYNEHVKIPGILSLVDSKTGEKYTLEMEDANLPHLTFMHDYERPARNLKASGLVGFLAARHMEAGGGGSNTTGYQFNVLRAYGSEAEKGKRDGSMDEEARLGEPWYAVQKSIEFALSQFPKGEKVDPEDLCVVARHGKQVLSDAKRLSGSNDYHTYKFAKRENGKDVIDEDDREFIDKWLGQINARCPLVYGTASPIGEWKPKETE